MSAASFDVEPPEDDDPPFELDEPLELELLLEFELLLDPDPVELEEALPSMLDESTSVSPDPSSLVEADVVDSSNT